MCGSCHLDRSLNFEIVVEYQYVHLLSCFFLDRREERIAVLVSEYVANSPHIQCMALSFVLGQLALLSRSAFKAV